MLKAQKEGYDDEVFAVKRYHEVILREDYLRSERRFRFDLNVLTEITLTRELKLCSNVI